MRCAFDEDDDLWRVSTDAGEEITARFLVPAVGGLERPKLPDIDGIDDFEGTPDAHRDVGPRRRRSPGKRVAVIGTGATVAAAVPEIADAVEHLDVYQRTPIWVEPEGRLRDRAARRGSCCRSRRSASALRACGHARRRGRAIGGMLACPAAGGAAASGAGPRPAAAMDAQPGRTTRCVREKLIPRLRARVQAAVDVQHLPASTFNRDDVDLVTDPIERITATGDRHRRRRRAPDRRARLRDRLQA